MNPLDIQRPEHPQHPQRPEHPDLQWSEIHEMLQSVKAALETTTVTGPSSDADILRRRAKEYGMRNGNGVERERNVRDVLLFSLGDRTYALPCSDIEEVIPMQSLVALPSSNRAILGISNNRGVLFAVVDIKRLLNIPASELTTMHRVVILRHDTYRIGTLVDAVHGMDSVDVGALKELPRELSEQTRSFLSGISADGMLMVSAEEIIRQMAATEAAASK